jgi:hypothetical protein
MDLTVIHSIRVVVVRADSVACTGPVRGRWVSARGDVVGAQSPRDPAPPAVPTTREARPWFPFGCMHACVRACGR